MDTPLARTPAWRCFAQEVTTGEYKSRVREPMERMKIGHHTRHMPQHLPVGQHQRTAIARAVLSRPKLILTDGPTGNLDTASGKEVMQLLTELNAEGTTVVMVAPSLPTPRTPIKSLASWTVPTRVS